MIACDSNKVMRVLSLVLVLPEDFSSKYFAFANSNICYPANSQHQHCSFNELSFLKVLLPIRTFCLYRGMLTKCHIGSLVFFHFQKGSLTLFELESFAKLSWLVPLLLVILDKRDSKKDANITILFIISKRLFFIFPTAFLLSLEVSVLVFVTSLEASLIVSSTVSKTFFILWRDFCFPNLTCNLKNYPRLCNETDLFNFSISSLFLIEYSL